MKDNKKNTKRSVATGATEEAAEEKAEEKRAQHLANGLGARKGGVFVAAVRRRVHGRVRKQLREDAPPHLPHASGSSSSSSAGNEGERGEGLWNRFDLARARGEQTVAVGGHVARQSRRLHVGVGCFVEGKWTATRQQGRRERERARRVVFFGGEVCGGGEYIGVWGLDHIGVGRAALAVVRGFVVGGVDLGRRPLAP